MEDQKNSGGNSANDKNADPSPSGRNQANGNAAESTGRASFSLVMKLNLHTILYTFGVLLTVNIVLCLAVMSLTLWKAEDRTAALMEEFSPRDTTVMEFRFVPADPDSAGIRLLNEVNRFTPLSNYQVTRWIWFDTTTKHPLKTLKYRMVFEQEKTAVIYPIGMILADYLRLLYALLILEALILLTGIAKGRREIRRILRPLLVMTKQAQNLSASAAGDLQANEMKRLRELAGTISNIDATKLDKRLSVDGTQNELKDLANAINSMLNRIDEAYRSQVRFVSDASHELRTPISVIQGYANLLDRWGKNDQATLQEAIDAIKSEAESMKDLIEQLLFLARGDNETLHLDLEVFNCSEMIEEIFKETQLIDTLHTFRMKNDTLAFVNADRQLLKQAMRILIENSIKYTPANGEIVVSIADDLDLIRISVQDNGIGIDPENLPYIFDRFYRSDESRARKTGGSGLGLAIMKWIIDRHGGTIEVISRKDIGTRTTILLPKVTLQDSFEQTP
ncbi:sensor histidine kinase [Anoxybacterium hadale]|uniref:Sensor histidine kinase n=2 Tax=Anoxybacterium hadale TaxID=3408580 RepID=A0ACD1AHL4_9FIRM|nr:sensor histidine kinase [Clostridiales bacterium]